MSVAVDATSTADNHVAGPTTSNSFNNLTIGTGGSNYALIVVAGVDINTPGTWSAVWDSGGTNQTMQLLGSLNGTGSCSAAIFGLVAPTAGKKICLVSVTNSVSDFYVDAMSFTGVNQTGGATSFPNFTSLNDTSATATINITSAVGDYTISCMSTIENMNSNNQTLLHYDHIGSVSNFMAQYAAGTAPNVTHTFNLAAAPSGHPLIGVDIKATVGALLQAGLLPLMGVG